MKNIFLISVTFFALILFSGCPYESSYPLGDMGKEQVPVDWEGDFKNVDAADQLNRVKISLDMSNLFVCKIKGPSATGDATEMYEGYYTKIAGQEFLYVKLNDTKAGRFYLYGINIEGDQYKCREVSVDALNTTTITSTQELRKAVETKLKEGKLFGALHVFKAAE